MSTIANRIPPKRRLAVRGTRAGARAVRRDARVQALLHDEHVRHRLRDAAVNARVVYLRATRRGDVAEALLEDRKGRRALRRMIAAVRDAAATVRGAKRRQRRLTAMRVAMPLVVAGGVGALARSKAGAAASQPAATENT